MVTNSIHDEEVTNTVFINGKPEHMINRSSLELFINYSARKIIKTNNKENIIKKLFESKLVWLKVRPVVAKDGLVRSKNTILEIDIVNKYILLRLICYIFYPGDKKVPGAQVYILSIIKKGWVSRPDHFSNFYKFGDDVSLPK